MDNYLGTFHFEPQHVRLAAITAITTIRQNLRNGKLVKSILPSEPRDGEVMILIEYEPGEQSPRRRESLEASASDKVLQFIQLYTRSRVEYFQKYYDETMKGWPVLRTQECFLLSPVLPTHRAAAAQPDCTIPRRNSKMGALSVDETTDILRRLSVIKCEEEIEEHNKLCEELDIPDIYDWGQHEEEADEEYEDDEDDEECNDDGEYGDDERY